MKTMKWRATIGLLAVYIATIFKLTWLWGLICLIWIIPDIRRGNTHLFELVTRHQNPVLFWLICLSWLGVGIYMLLSPFLGLEEG